MKITRLIVGLICCFFACDGFSVSTIVGWPSELGQFKFFQHKPKVGTTIIADPDDLSFPNGLSENKGGFVQYRGGPLNGCVIYGPYRSLGEDGKNEILAYLDIEFAVNPDTYKTCHKRDWQGKCVGWTTHYQPHGFTIDITSDVGQNVLATRSIGGIEKQERSLLSVVDGPLFFDGEQHNLEVRVCDPYGGQFDIRVYQMMLYLF